MEAKMTFTLEDAKYYSKRFRDMAYTLNFEDMDDMFDEIAEDYTTEDNVCDLYSMGESEYSTEDFLAITIFVDLYQAYREISNPLYEICKTIRKYTIA